jgi:hypothetical protein
VVGAGLTVLWQFTVGGMGGESASNDDRFAMVLAGLACIVGLGIAAMADRRTRWLGAGLVLGAVGAEVVLFMLLVLTVG